MERRIKIMLIILMALIVVAVLYFALKDINVNSNSGVMVTPSEETMSLDYLDESAFKNLRVYIDLPVRSGDTGNKDLFGY